jgi:hypothetical protein
MLSEMHPGADLSAGASADLSFPAILSTAPDLHPVSGGQSDRPEMSVNVPVADQAVLPDGDKTAVPARTPVPDGVHRRAGLMRLL